MIFMIFHQNHQKSPKSIENSSKIVENHDFSKFSSFFQNFHYFFKVSSFFDQQRPEKSSKSSRDPLGNSSRASRTQLGSSERIHTAEAFEDN